MTAATVPMSPADLMELERLALAWEDNPNDNADEIVPLCKAVTPLIARIRELEHIARVHGEAVVTLRAMNRQLAGHTARQATCDHWPPRRVDDPPGPWYCSRCGVELQ